MEYCQLVIYPLLCSPAYVVGMLLARAFGSAILKPFHFRLALEYFQAFCSGTCNFVQKNICDRVDSTSNAMLTLMRSIQKTGFSQFSRHTETSKYKIKKKPIKYNILVECIYQIGYTIHFVCVCRSFDSGRILAAIASQHSKPILVVLLRSILHSCVLCGRISYPRSFSLLEKIRLWNE